MAVEESELQQHYGVGGEKCQQSQRQPRVHRDDAARAQPASGAPRSHPPPSHCKNTHKLHKPIYHHHQTKLTGSEFNQSSSSEQHNRTHATRLSDKILFRAFWIAMVVALSREVCGAIPVLNFAGEIFTMASGGSGLVLTANQQAMMLGLVQVAGAALASSIVEKTGRKKLLISTSLVSGLSMCGLATYFLAKNYGFYAPDWLPIATLCLCIFCDASGLQPVSVVLTSEMFSFKYRGTVMATAMASSSLVDFIQMLFFKPLANAVGIHVAFYFFGFICIISAIYVILKVPETKMRSLEEIHRDLRTKKEKALEDSKDPKQLEA
ncbi:hypothetical protein MSG28_013865 [Choristoneura fumiferana]|uniref:Uncharacterized protein n=1 Tax=Choristoneura fumiferana TaxID=7141 RepID=A0ACC0K9R7_CHOFU|nr:hypothetical protein MSG28_013865 [Choristoneura fumiferana]